MKSRFHSGCCIAVSLLGFSLPAGAEIRLPAVFSDHAMLQRSKETSLWGGASAGAKVVVRYAGRESSAAADADGRWKVALDLSQVSGKGSDLVVEEQGSSVTVRDVVVGEVWLSSGQSNMQFTLNSTDDGWEEIERSKDPDLRWFMAEAGETYLGPQEYPAGRWLVAGPETSGDCSAVAYYFGRKLRSSTRSPVGLILTAVGGTTIQSWMSPEALASVAELREEHGRVQALIRKAGTGDPGIPPQEIPCFYYNQMIHPLEQATLAGVIWYQGEAHFNQEGMYVRAFPALIRDWRSKFGRADLPFYFCQLPNMEPKTGDAGDAGWIAGIREAQDKTSSEPATGQVVLIDAGDEDMHPTNKKVVGDRLAALAEVFSYRIPNPLSVYPRQTAVEKQEGGKVVIRFNGCDGGLVASKLARKDIQASGGIATSDVQGFALKSAEGTWHWATARISGDAVEVSSPEVPSPREVRYAWSNNPTCNLTNKAGLPVGPFSMDLK